MAEGGEMRVRLELKILQLLQKLTTGFYEQPGKHTWRRHALCKSAGLNSSPRDPPFCTFRMLLLSLQKLTTLR